MLLKAQALLESATIVFLKVEGEIQNSLVLQLKVKTVSKNSQVNPHMYNTHKSIQGLTLTSPLLKTPYKD